MTTATTLNLIAPAPAATSLAYMKRADLAATGTGIERPERFDDTLADAAREASPRGDVRDRDEAAEVEARDAEPVAEADNDGGDAVENEAAEKSVPEESVLSEASDEDALESASDDAEGGALRELIGGTADALQQFLAAASALLNGGETSQVLPGGATGSPVNGGAVPSGAGPAPVGQAPLVSLATAAGTLTDTPSEGGDQAGQGSAGGQGSSAAAVDAAVAASGTAAIDAPPTAAASPAPLPAAAASDLSGGAAVTLNPLTAPGPATPAADAASTTATAAPNPEAADPLNAARLSRGLDSALNQRNGSVTLRLTPPELGTVRIELQVQGTSVAAQFHAETDRGMTLLTQQLAQLRSSLEAQGLTVERVGVQAMTTPSSQGSNLNQNSDGNASDQQRAGQDAGDGRSRGRFFQERDPDAEASASSPRDRDRAADRPRFDRLYHATRSAT